MMIKIEDAIKSESEYMQLFGAEKESFAAGARWAWRVFSDTQMVKKYNQMEKLLDEAVLENESLRQRKQP